MAQRKHLAAEYAPEYEHLLRAAADPLKRETTITFTSAAKAYAMRHKFYAYLRALREEALRPDLCLLANAITVRLEGVFLIVNRSEDDQDLVAIRSALSIPKGTAVPLASAPLQKANNLRERLDTLRTDSRPSPHSFKK